MSPDTVLDELNLWEDKDLKEYSQYIAEHGLLNEFKCHDVGAARVLSIALHRLQADGMPPGTRGKR